MHCSFKELFDKQSRLTLITFYPLFKYLFLKKFTTKKQTSCCNANKKTEYKRIKTKARHSSSSSLT